MRQLSRSKTVWLLRTPAPYRSVAALLFLVASTAVTLRHTPAMTDRARLAELLVNASALRIDPMEEFANSGRWPEPRQIVVSTISIDSEPRMRSNVTAQGIEIVKSFDGMDVRFSLDSQRSPGDMMAWRCRLDALDPATPLSPLSIPAVCAQ